MTAAPAGHYVYVHRTLAGVDFYVGAGKGESAWKAGGGEALWNYYVRTYLGGEYTVVILKDHLTQEAAHELKQAELTARGEHMVNWANPGRYDDAVWLRAYCDLSRRHRALMLDARAEEKANPDLALALYREAKLADDEARKEYRSERSLVGRLQREIDEASGAALRGGCLEALDRITLLLRRLQRHEEIIREVDTYFETYPFPISPRHAVNKRRAEALAILADGQK